MSAPMPSSRTSALDDKGGTTGRTTPAPAATPATPTSSRILAEQLRLLLQQWVRIPLPIAVLIGYVGFLAWPYGDAAAVLAWSSLTAVALFVRAFACRRLLKGERLVLDPVLLARQLVISAIFLGLLQGLAAPLFFPYLPFEQQALLTMLMCAWGAGAVVTSGPYLPVYFAFSLPFFAEVLFAWVRYNRLQSPFVAILIVLFVGIVIAFARDNARQVAKSIDLRFENKQLLDQKEELIKLLEVTVEKAESARRQAEEANLSKSRFLASASHDLRQPLHALSLLTALLNDMSRDSGVREIGQHIERSVRSLDRLFNALLDLSKLDAGAMTPEFGEVRLADLFEQLALEYRPKAQQRGLKFSVECNAICVSTDPILLERIIRNLLENAIRFTFAGGITLWCEHAGGRDAKAGVSDTGIGISEMEYGRVFDEFYQLHNPGRDRSQGLGLGLSIVKRIADLLGYRIGLSSHLGKGSTFWITLAGAVVAGSAPGHARAAEDRDTPDISGLRVLVIEDDSEARAAMYLTLRRWGCEPVTAASLEEAKAATANGFVPDVVLSDLRLEHGESGVTAIRALQEMFGAIPAALVTGDIARDKLLELRAADLPVLHKPVPPDDLKRTLSVFAREALHR